MESPEIKFDLMTISDRDDGRRPRRDVLEGVEVPVFADGYARGPRSLLATATLNELIIGSAAGVVLEHPSKRPLLFVVHVGTEPAFERQGLEAKLVFVLEESAREAGYAGLWFKREVATLLREVACEVRH